MKLLIEIKDKEQKELIELFYKLIVDKYEFIPKFNLNWVITEYMSKEDIEERLRYQAKTHLMDIIKLGGKIALIDTAERFIFFEGKMYLNKCLFDNNSPLMRIDDLLNNYKELITNENYDMLKELCHKYRSISL